MLVDVVQEYEPLFLDILLVPKPIQLAMYYKWPPLIALNST